MNDDLKNECAQMLFTQICQDLAQQDSISQLEAKISLINSGTYDDNTLFNALKAAGII